MLDGAIGKSLARCGYQGQKSANSAQVKTGVGLITKQILGPMGTDRTKEKIMRIMAFVLASALAVCFMDPASAASRRSGQSANPDRGPYPVSAGCGGVSCYRSGSQKIQKHKMKH
jgi:hypothetical protein